jgi:hypothetical protein
MQKNENEILCVLELFRLLAMHLECFHEKQLLNILFYFLALQKLY